MLTDARVLEEDWVPRELHHREGHIQHLSSQLEPLTHGLAADDILVTGPSGTGKTTIARYVAEKLTQQVLDVRAGYVNCHSNSTKTAVCYALLQEAGRANDLRPEGTPTSVYFDRLQELDAHFVAILDEVAVLEDDTTLQALHDYPGVTLLLVAVAEDDLFADLDSRVVSRLRGAAHVRLDKYSHDELCDILHGRIDAALRPGVLKTGVVDRIADIAASDARHAITLLSRAVSEAMQEEAGALTLEHVETAPKRLGDASTSATSTPSEPSSATSTRSSGRPARSRPRTSMRGITSAWQMPSRSVPDGTTFGHSSGTTLSDRWGRVAGHDTNSSSPRARPIRSC